MKIDLPENWEELVKNIQSDTYIAKNTKTEVSIGYLTKNGGSTTSYLLWVGNHSRDRERITTVNGSKEQLKVKALDFMQENPEYEYSG